MSPAVSAALRRFTVMAVVVGVGLLILCLHLVLKYGFDDDRLEWWSPVHGVLFMLYLVATVDLGLKDRWPLARLVVVMLAGVVPLFSFVMERKVARQVRRPGGRSTPTAPIP